MPLAPQLSPNAGSPPENKARSVLYVSAVADLKGGAETVLCEMLRNPHVDASLAVPGPGELADAAASLGREVHMYELGGVAAVRRPARPRDLAVAARDGLRVAHRLAEIARDCDAGLIHTNGLKVHVTGVIARRLHGTRTVVHMHDVPYTRSERLIWHGLAAGATHTIAASAICFGARRPARMSVIMQGVDAVPAQAPRVLPRHPVIGFVGRFHPFKGVHLLLDWFEAAAADFPDARLLLRGRADREGRAYWEEQSRRAEALATSGRCRVEDWLGPGADPFEGIDVLAAPSATPEVGPRVIMEAMLRGIPAIGYPAGGALQMIPGPQYGAHAASPGEFASALRRLLDPSTYRAVSGAALSHAAANFGIERFWRELDGLYRSL